MQIDPVKNVVSVHGREALDLPYNQWTDDEVPTQVDISQRIMFIEIPAAHIRKQLLLDQFDAKGLRIVLTREEVARIPTTPTPYVIIDETNIELPSLEFESRIYRTGYTEAPVPPNIIP